MVILQVVKNNLNPSWMSFSIALATLCGGDYDAPIRVSSIIMIIINGNYYQFNLKVDKICVTKALHVIGRFKAPSELN